MPVKKFLLIALLLPLAFGPLTGCSTEVEAEERTARNVLLICVDTLRADRMSTYGYGRETTPALDRFAERGVVFERASSGSSWTLPSMAMLMTGDFRAGKKTLSAEDLYPLAHVMQANGFQTAGFVANPILSPVHGFERGWDHYDVQQRPLPGRPKAYWPAEQMVDKGIDWLANNSEQPFLLYLHLLDPHFPYEPLDGNVFDDADELTQKNFQELRARLGPGAAETFTWSMFERVIQARNAYDSEILQADQQLARLFDYLDETGLAQETLVVLTSDHGEALWEHSSADGWTKINETGLASMLYRGHGEQLRSNLVQVPLILVGPGLPTSTRVARGVSLVDVYPTILTALGIDIPPGTQGLNLLDTLHATGKQEREIFSVCSRGATITEGDRYRLHLPGDDLLAKGALVALYDLETDPEEARPIVDEARTAALRERLERWKHEVVDTIDASGEVSKEKVRELLIGMGYLSLAKELDERDMSIPEINQAMRDQKEDSKEN